jgi:hypothetical protein
LFIKNEEAFFLSAVNKADEYLLKVHFAKMMQHILRSMQTTPVLYNIPGCESKKINNSDEKHCIQKRQFYIRTQNLTFY